VYQRQHSGGSGHQQYANHEPVVPHQPKVQSMHYGPGGGQTYEQHSPDQYQSDTAQVTHSQYNTPIGLYSQQNVKEALDAQTTGKPGQGTLQVSGTGPDGKKTFNPAQSDVYRLLMEEEGGKRPRGHGLAQQQQQHQHHQPEQSARYADHSPGQEMQYHGYQDHTMQSRSMHNLEYNMSHGNEEYGTSDF
jgi:cytoskeletal protein RodZ